MFIVCAERFWSTQELILLNQIAKKRNSYDELNALERADLKVLEGKIQEVVVSIKTQVE